jgi:membrane-associated phospholipid phosphatase
MQDVIVFLIVCAAGGYLGRHWWQSMKGGKACGGCAGACGKPAAKPQPQLVQIDLNGSFRK